MLSLLLIIPIIGSITVLLVTDGPSGDKSKKIALATSLINLVLSIYLWIQFDSSTSQYQFVYSFKELSYCHLNIGVDGLSIYFVLLTTFITPIALLSNYNNINNNLKYFLISFLLLETLQIALFVVLDLLLFYVFFESVLPVLFIVIILYGSGEAKIRSALLFFLYTLAGSLFMLLAILEISNYVGSTDFQLISLSEINLDSQKLLWLAFFLAFAIKTPLWPMTGWLYRAHADSPLAGSILLAGTILKLATYGYLRVLINFLPDATHYFSPLVQTIALITIVYASLATIIQQDTKALIAYSSICHMGVVILGLFSNTIQGIEGAILFAIAHGFVSPALFICVGGVIYERTGVRLINYIRGLVTYMPVFTILFFIFTLCNTGIPLSLNFLGEQMSLIGIWERSPFAAVIGATGIVFSACYSIYLYNRLSYGSYSPYLKPLRDITRREFILLISLLIPTVVLGIYPNVILDTLHASVTTLLYNIPLTLTHKSCTDNIDGLSTRGKITASLTDKKGLKESAVSCLRRTPGRHSNSLTKEESSVALEVGEDVVDFIRKIIQIENVKKEIEILQYNDRKLINKSYAVNCSYNPIKKDGEIVNSMFNEMEIGLTSKILTDKNYKNYCRTVACCYIITFENKYYYYIGSTANIKNRFKTHTLNINNYYVNNSTKGLSNFLKYFLINEYNGKKPTNFNINIVYLTTNYLNKFQEIYPNYKLSKGEWILLNKITDFIVKILEESLILHFHPKLNSAKKVVFKHFEWNDESLQIYSENGKASDYLKAKKYAIYLKCRDKSTLNLMNEPIRITTLQDLCSRYRLNKEEVLSNLNYYHHYNGTIFRYPLKIVEIK
uniref:NADH dehydrogenase subunit 4 n=1 Tax=Porodaedalea chrysoloma TaxID=74615 RepID=UPI0023AA9CCF|nr:NADH dehydrogenase subunit 4 [Porodaedalea chrysoloma]WCF76787.1 NADH dehydrogenase subunit 4 [Porodaedalea chrysoloma]